MQPVFAVSGDKSSGKTTFLQNVVTILQNRGMDVQGFLAFHDMKHDFYHLQNIQSQEILPFMKRRFPPQPWPDHFEIYDEGISAGNTWINHALIHHPALFVMDEIGAFELYGKIWYDGFSKLIEAGIPLLFSTHTRFLSAVNAKWNITPPAIVTAPDTKNAEKFSKRLEETLKNHKTNDSKT